MTPSELAAIEARANAATPGPWRLDTDGDVIADEVYGVVGVAEVYGHRDKADAAFIAAVRTDVPRLIAEVKRLRGNVGTETNSTPMTYENVRAMIDRHDGEPTYNGSTLCALRILRDEIDRLKSLLDG